MEGYPDFDDLEERLESLKKRRHNLGSPLNGELKQHEGAPRYAVDNLDSEEFDVYHLLDVMRASEESEEPHQSLFELIGGNFTWEDALDVFEESFSNTESPDSVEKALAKQVDVHRYLRSLRGSIPDELEHLLFSHQHRARKSLEVASDATFAAMGSSIDLGDELESSATRELEEKVHYGLPPGDTQQEYKDVEVSLPEAGNLLRYELASFALDWYEERISEAEEDLDRNRQPEKITRTVSSTNDWIDWQQFEEEYGSAPEEGMREFYETAVRYHSSDAKLDTQLLEKVISDLNGADVEYTADQKDLAENFGDLKKAVDDSNLFDYDLPVMGKRRELQRISETVSRAAEFYNNEVQQIVRERQIN